MVVRSALTLILTWNLTKISVLAFQSWALTEQVFTNTRRYLQTSPPCSCVLAIQKGRHNVHCYGGECGERVAVFVVGVRWVITPKHSYV